MMRLLPFIVVVPLLAGCVHYKPQPLSPAQTATMLESRRLDDPKLRQFVEQNLGHALPAWPLKSWDLNSLTLAAFYFHPGLEVAHDQWLAASADIKTAAARPNPSVTVNPSYDSQIPGNYSPWIVPITFDLPIETAGKRSKRIAEAEAASESARWNFVAAAWQIRSDVRTSLLDLQTASHKADLLAQQFATQKKIVSLMQQRLEAGEISRADLAIAKIALNKTQMDLSDAQYAQTSARSHLAESLGLTASALDGQKLEFSFPTPSLRELASAQAREVALRSRADVLAALSDYAVAEDDLRLQVAKQYPDLHLGPGYAWNNGNAGDNQWSLGLTLELPILDQNQGPIAQAIATRKLAAAKFIQLQSQVIAEIDRAVADLHAAQEQLKNGNILVAAERQQEKDTQSQLEAGAGDPMDVLNARLETDTVLMSQLDNEAKRQAAINALEDALQRPADSLASVIAHLPDNQPVANDIHP